MNEKIIIYQTFPRIFGNQNTTNHFDGTIQMNGCGKMGDYTEKALRSIKSLGCNYIWYTGIIQQASKTDNTAYGCPRQNPYVIKGNAGSPYAISDYYSVSPDIAKNPKKRMEEFDRLVERTHKAGMRMLIDFVPNHVARVYRSVMKPADEKDFGENDNTKVAFDPQNNFYYIPNQGFAPHIDLGNGEDMYVEFPAKATGNDCFQPYPGINDWYETIKLNYGVNYADGSKHFTPTPDTWKKMLNILLYWAEKGVDGFRCDMVHMVPIEFWQWAVPQVKEKFPEIIFVAEIYTPSMYRDYIFRGGFDYLYDKVGLYDTLRAVVECKAPASAITGCWQSLEGIQQYMLNFLENHDEQRIASDYFAQDPQKAIPALAVSALINTSPFMLYFGQELGEKGMDLEGFSGRDGRTTIFDYWSLEKMIRWNNKGKWDGSELTQQEKTLRQEYQQILTMANKEKAISQGSFYDLMYANYNNPDFDTQRQYAFLRKKDNELIIVIANFRHEDSQIRINIPAHAFEFLQIVESEYKFTQLLSQESKKAELNSTQGFSCKVKANSAAVWKVRVK